ncbi:MAG: N(4)-(beta-N-acetylglucosaminyl)-L-asparaginase [Bryobacteraceae bacterium]
MFTRRNLILASAAFAAAPAAAQSQGRGDVVISSSNGLRACDKAMEMLKAGDDSLDAVIAGVNINEDDPEDDSVGYGGLPNEQGVVELDACVMHGPTRRCGAVAALRNIRNPSKVARVVMESTDHVMLVGDGALHFAKAFGFEEENLLTEKARLAWLVWKQSLRDASGHGNWTDGLDAPPSSEPKRPPAALRKLFPEADQQTLAWAYDRAIHPVTGTISCLALNRKGEISGCTTTSGLAWKIPGRAGDSPIIGAGLFVDQEVGAAGSTGRGEENIRIAGGHTVVENMRHGMPPREACLDALKRVARNYNNDLSRLERFNLNFYALRKDGEYAAASLWNRTGDAPQPRSFAVNDGAGKARLENCAYLYERK